MADAYKFSGKSSMFFDSMYNSQAESNELEAAMARVCPCMFFFNGECVLNADTYASEEEAENPGENLKTKCIGAKVRCDYYTKSFEYLNKEYVKDGKGILAEHVIEIFKEYLRFESPYGFVDKFATVDGISAYMGVTRGNDESPIVLSRRSYLYGGSIISKSYHPPSLEYKDYISFVTNGYFKVLFPRLIFPTDVEDTIYQDGKVAVFLDVPGNGYSYIIYLKELHIEAKMISVFNHFFETGETVDTGSEGSSRYTLSSFFDTVISKLKEKNNNKLIVVGESVGFGINLMELSSQYDLSECLIVYSERPIVFTKTMFDINSTVIGKLSIDSTKCIKLYMSYADISFGSNSIYDLSVDHTLSIVNSDEEDTDPKVEAAYKGQDLAFCASINTISKKIESTQYNEDTGNVEPTDPEDGDISVTAIQLPWYNSDETNKKYLWSINAEVKKYSLDIDPIIMKKEFDDGEVTFFKNMLFIRITNPVFPFYITNCKFNGYTYKSKYQAYHPMLEYYDINMDEGISFSNYVSSSFIDFSDIQQDTLPNSNRSQSSDSGDPVTSSDIYLLKSLPCGMVILVPDVNKYGENFIKDNFILEFKICRGDKIEYIADTSKCEDTSLFIPDKCDRLEQFELNSLIGDSSGGVEEKLTKVKLFEEEEEDDDDGDGGADSSVDISISTCVKDQNEVYYIEVEEDLDVDEGTGAAFKQKNITGMSYFYTDYLSFNFLIDSVSDKSKVIEETEEGEGDTKIKVRVEQISEDGPPSEDSPIQKLLSGERPLLSIDDLDLSQEETSGDNGKEQYDFKYLYEKTVRSFINNRFYEIFPIDLLVGKGSSSAGYSWLGIDADSIFKMPGISNDSDCAWMLPFSESVSDFYILKKEEDGKTQEEDDSPEQPAENNHNLTHISNVSRVFGLTRSGFNKAKVEFVTLLEDSVEDSENLVKGEFETKLNTVFYFYIFGISKFVQDYLFLVKYNEHVIPIIKKIPVVVSQVGLPDPEISYKWKSKCSIYTYLYDTGLNPFTKVHDTSNLDFFINPFYVIVHKDFRDDKYDNTRTATNDYGFLFSTNWWVKYKQKLDNFGYVGQKSTGTHTYNAFLDVYKTMCNLGQSAPTEGDIKKGFSKGKDILYIELESIDYVYQSYCGDHDFVISNTTPYLYDRTADQGLTSGVTDPRNEDIDFNFVYYTGDYDKKGVGMRRSRPCSRLVGPMWFPFRACEVARYHEFADYPSVRYLLNASNELYYNILCGFSCTDLIFKPQSDNSELKDLFIDDCFGSLNPYRYTSSFYSIDVLSYYESSGSTIAVEVAPTYLASDASVPFRSIPIFYNKKHMVLVKSNSYTIEDTEIPISCGGFETYVDIDMSSYEEFKVSSTNLIIKTEDKPVPGENRSILYNCLIDIPPILPYNYNRDKYVCGYERMRGGDANFIYQCVYPYHHNYPFLNGCMHVCDYEHKGEECHGDMDNTLLPHVLPVATDAGMIILGSLFYSAMYARFICPGYLLESMPCPIPNSFKFVKDFLAEDDIPHVNFYWVSEQLTKLENENDEFWSNFDTLECKTDGPDIMKACFNKYTAVCEGYVHDAESGDNRPFTWRYDFNGLMFVPKEKDCTECFNPRKCESHDNVHVTSYSHAESNLISKPLYYHFAADHFGTYRYILLGASMKSKPSFYGNGALRMYENYDKLKMAYTIFDKDLEVHNVGALPVFGGIGKFFKMCYFSTNYGKVPFSTLSGVNTDDDDDDDDRDDNYVYKLSGYTNFDAMFDNDYTYGYLPESNLVTTVDDIYLFSSLVSFTEDDSVKLQTIHCVRFEDLVEYVDVEYTGVGYYKYKCYDIKIETFGDNAEIESGPALSVIYDTSILNSDKYNYYSEYGLKIHIPDVIIGDVKVVDPFPFGDEVTIRYRPIFYDEGYLRHDYIDFEIEGIKKNVIIRVKVKDNASDDRAWKFCVEEEVETVDNSGNKKTKTVDTQVMYLCYDDSYAIGKLVVKDDDDDMLLSSRDVVSINDVKYKINRGFYLDFSNTILPYDLHKYTYNLNDLTKAGFSTSPAGCDCFCSRGSSSKEAPYITIHNNSFIISLKGSFFSPSKYNELAVVGYICLETLEEYYTIGNLYAIPEIDRDGEYVKYHYQNTKLTRYRYNFHFSPYKNYNKIKYCGTKYRLVFSNPVYFCEDPRLSVDVEYGCFNGGDLCKINFSTNSSLKAITYSKEIEDICDDAKGINLYHENLNDTLIEQQNKVFYAMPFGFIYLLGGGITEDKETKFKEGYSGEFGKSGCNYSDDEQKQRNKITLKVEQDIFDMIHYPSCAVRFCLKSRFYEEITESYINLETSLVPNLYNSFGCIPIKQWVAPGHKLDLYPDSLYAGYAPGPPGPYQLAKAFANTDTLDEYKDDLEVLACIDTDDETRCKMKEVFKKAGYSSEEPPVKNGYVITPHNMCFITHSEHGMFGYKDITDVSDWINMPSKPTVYGFYDEDGEPAGGD